MITRLATRAEPASHSPSPLPTPSLGAHKRTQQILLNGVMLTLQGCCDALRRFPARELSFEMQSLLRRCVVLRPERRVHPAAPRGLWLCRRGGRVLLV